MRKRSKENDIAELQNLNVSLAYRLNEVRRLQKEQENLFNSNARQQRL